MKKRINLFIAGQARGTFNRGKLTDRLLIAAVIAANVAVPLMFLYVNLDTRSAVNALSETLNNAVLLSIQEENEELLSRIEVAKANIEVLNETAELAVQQNTFSSMLYNEAINLMPPDVTLLDFSFRQNTLTLDCLANNEKKPADYVMKLEKSNLFSNVMYGGFTSDSQNRVLFSVDCALERAV